MEKRRTRKLHITIAVLALLNVFQLLWFNFPLTAFGIPSVPDEETAIARERELYSRMFGEDYFAGKTIKAELIEESMCWRVVIAYEELMWDGGTDEVLFRMQDGKMMKIQHY